MMLTHKNLWYVVDVEADGPAPGLNSMVCFAAVAVTQRLDRVFYGRTAPLAGAVYDPEALAVSGFSRPQHEGFVSPAVTMISFVDWVAQTAEGRRPVFVSDNPAFDFAWINYYCHRFTGDNPFGWSARRIGDLWCGLEGNVSAPWKNRLRKTRHDHDPRNDARGNAEAILALAPRLRGLTIPEA